MSIPGAGNPLLLGGAGGYKIERSLRFNSADSAYLSRTPASAGNRKTWTWAGWVKRSDLGAGDQTLFSGGTTLSNVGGAILFFRNNKLCYSSIAADILQTEAVYRDASAWYHIVVAFDTTQATASSRLRFYVNGSEVTQFSTDARSAQLSQNTDYGVNQAAAHALGRFAYDGSKYFSGYLADVHFIDGQALTPSSFGETDTNGIWQPKAYSGSYGTNGFKLAFADNSAATATTLGKDTSGNGNNWTPNNLSVTAGAGNDSLVDSPTNYGIDTGAGGEVVGNYCTLNPLMLASPIALSNGNLDATGTNLGGTWKSQGSTFAITSGKWYWETTITAASAGFAVGIAGITNDLTVYHYPGYRASSYGYHQDGTKANDASFSAYGSALSVGVTVGVAFDADTGALTFYRNGVSQGVAFTVTTGQAYYPIFGIAGTGTCTHTCNFGQRPFAYTAPSGFKALCTTNLPEPTITDGSTVMDVKLYTGNGSTQTISGLDFESDLIWIKKRSGAEGHLLSDTVRGIEKGLYSNQTAVEDTYLQYGKVSAVSSTGFTVAATTNTPLIVNESGQTYAAWTWDAGSSTVTNTDGTISSQVRANASAGFSIVGYTCQSSGTGTIGHGLGVAPEFIITKQRAGTAFSWTCYHKAIGLQYILLNSTAAAGTLSTVWPTAATSTVFTQGTGFAGGGDMIAYCFAPVAGYSAFGSYTGNGSADGRFVYTGFRPRWVLVKTSTGSTGWVILDTARNTNNIANLQLFPHSSAAESTSPAYFACDFLSNGFKLRTADAASNGSGATYIYSAFAENPFQYARAR